MPTHTRHQQFPPVWRRHTLLLIALWVVTLAVYSGSFRSAFVMDSDGLILYDSRVQAATSENLGLILTQEYWSNHARTGLYRPLTTLSYLLNYSILGNAAAPAGYHWINFSLHALNIGLVYLLAWIVLKQMLPAAAVAAAWALHPVATESVTNIAGRADLLSAFGVLTVLLCHMKSAEASGGRKIAWLISLFLAAIIGFFSKESALAVLALMVLYDVTFRRASWRALAPGYLALALPMSAYLYIRARVLAPLPAAHVSFADNPLLGADFWTARLTAIKIIGNYLWLLLWPASLSCDYSYNQVPLVTWRFHTWEDWKAIIGLAVCLIAAGVTGLCYRRHKPVFYFIAFFFASLAPTANLVLLIGSIMAERFLYLPSIGLAGCLVVAIFAAGSRLSAKWAAPAALAIICSAFAIRTFVRNLDWVNPYTMAASAVRMSPASFKTHLMQAMALLEWGSTDDSIRELEASMRILDPLPDIGNAAVVYLRAGTLYRSKGDRVTLAHSGVCAAECGGWYKRSLDALLRAERVDRAVYEDNRRRNLSLGKTPVDTGFSLINLELGRTYLRLGEPRNAVDSLQKGLARALSLDMLLELSTAYQAMGKQREAVIPLFEAVVINPNDAKLMSDLIELYKKTDPHGCSLRNILGRPELNLECPLIQNDKCTAYRNVARAYQQFGYAQELRRTPLVQDCPIP